MTFRHRLATLFTIFFLTNPLLAQDKPRLVVQDGHKDDVTALGFRDGGAELFTASTDGTVKIWDIAEKRVVRSIYDKEKYDVHDTKPRLESVSHLSDIGHIMAASSYDFQRFDLESGQLVGTFRDEKYRGRFVSDQDFLYYVTTEGLKKTDLDGTQIKFLPHEGEFDSMKSESLTIGQNTLAVASSKDILFIDKETLTIKSRIPFDGFLKQALSSDDAQLAVATSKEFRVYDVATGKVTSSKSKDFLTGKNENAYNFQPYWLGGQLYWARNSDSIVENEALFIGPDVVPVKNPDIGYVKAIGRGPRGELLIAGINGNFLVLESDGKTQKFGDQAAGTAAFKVSLANDYLATGSRDGTVKVWNLKTGKLWRKYEGLRAYVGAIDISPDGSKLVASDLFYGEILTWDIKTGKQLSKVKVRAGRFGEGASSVNFINVDSYLLTRTQNGRVSVYNAYTGQEEDYRDFGKKGVRLIAFHPGGRRVATVQSGGQMTEWSLDSKRDRLSIDVPRGTGSRGYLAYAQDGQSLLVTSSTGGIYRWEYDDPENKLETFAQPWNRMNPAYFIEEKGTVLTVGDYGRVTRFYKDRKLEVQTPLAKTYISRPQRVSDDLFLFNSGADALVLANIRTGEYLGEIVEFDSGKGWAVFTGDGKFDGNDLGLKQLDFELDGSVYRLSQFFNEYYTPGLLTSLFPNKSGSKKGPARALTAKTLKKPPKVDITAPKSGMILEQADLEVTVKVTERGAGASNVALYHNGHRLPDKNRTEIDATTFKFKVKAVKGVNDIRATAFDSSGSVEARRDRVRVVAPNLQARQPRLHLLAVGVDDYKSGLTLKFADDDAKSVSELFSSDLYEQGERVLLTNAEATLGNILGEVDKLSEVTEPQDVLVVYLAGHGTVVGKTYYFLPHDAEVGSDQELATSALSSVQLAQKLSSIPATKQLLVLDSCRSGAMVEGPLALQLAARDGIDEIRSQQMLARTSGTFLIAATQADDYAYEIPELGHGVLTYSILNSLGKTGDNKQKATTANGLVRNVSELVPALTQKYHNKTQRVVQFSSGQDFPLTR